MKLQLLNKAILRVPQFPADALLATSWDDLKASIKISSSDFYKQIKDVDSSGIEQLPPAIFNTVWKYFNRARYRATPYGSFAGLGLINISSDGNDKVIIDPEQIQHSFIDWPYKKNVTINTKILMAKDGYFIANNSYYVLLNAIRYLSYIDNRFELSEIENSPMVLKILACCKQPIKVSELEEMMLNDFTDLDELQQSLDYLIELQLLFSNLHPNIIGQDYFERIGISNAAELSQYVISERKILMSEFNSRYFKDLPDLAIHLQQIISEYSNPQLEKFTADFSKKFELQEVSLMLALDPEIGISYGDMEQSGAGTLDLIAELVGRKPKANFDFASKELKDFLTNELITANGKQPVVVNLSKLSPNRKEKLKFPNTFCAILSDADGMFCLENLGGSTATSLAGRFSIMNEEVKAYCKSIALLEQEANPEVLFFDIAYTAENEVDNINRRVSIYNYQLSILNYNDSSDPLDLDDLYLSVFKGKLILRSKRLNKRLIPRLASAYNYGRSDLAIFRLFCDMQSQSLTTSLLFNIPELIPGLNYYPRIKYKNIIVSRAKWQLSFAEFIAQSNTASLPYFKKYLCNKKIGPYFRTGTADQTLFFALDDDKSLAFLMDSLKKKKTVIIEEAFMNKEPFAIDIKGAGYCSEWIVGLCHNEEIYKGRISANSVEKDIKAIITPGGKWLYFEIFSHPQRANEILIDKIAFVLKLHSGLIHRWFFIRYTENGHHIRLRIFLKNVSDVQTITATLADSLNKEIQSGVVHDFTLRTYKRELARYGSRNIERVESHFHVDSNYVLNIISQSPEDYRLYVSCTTLVFFLRDSKLLDPPKFDELLSRISDAMNKEHMVDIFAFKKLNAAYKDFQKSQHLNLQSFENMGLFQESFLDTLRFCLPENREQLFADLMHMHINRLFSTNQRTHEMIFYYFLNKQITEYNKRTVTPIPL